MPFQKEEVTDDHISELKRKHRELTEQLADIFSEYHMTPEELEKYLANPDNFTSEEQEFIEKSNCELNSSLERDLANIPNPRKTKTTYKKLRKSAGWIQV